MSFADPHISGAYGCNATPTWPGAVNNSFARQADGKYINTTSGTADEPILYIIGSSYKPGGVSTFTHRATRNKNVAPINGVPQSDDILSVSVQVKYPHRSFLGSDMSSLACLAIEAFVNATYRDKILTGQR